MRDGGQGRPYLRTEGMEYLLRQGGSGYPRVPDILCNRSFPIDTFPIANPERIVNINNIRHHNVFLINF